MLNASVIIPTFNRPDILSHALRPLLSEIREAGAPAEIVVVDDGTDETYAPRIADLVKTFDTKRLVLVRHDINLGLSAARNSGAQRARGEILIFIDDDLIPSPTFIRDHIAFHEAHPEIPLLCGHLFTSSRSLYGRYWSRCYQHVFCEPANGRDLYPIDMLSGGNHSVKRDVLEILSPLFDSALPSREDMDLYLRAREAGLNVYKTTRAAAEVVPKSTFSAFYKQKQWYARGEILLRAKHGESKVAAAEARHPTPLTPDMLVLTVLLRLREKIDSWTARRGTKAGTTP